MKYNEFYGIEFDEEDYKQIAKDILKNVAILFENGKLDDCYNWLEKLSELINGEK